MTQDGFECVVKMYILEYNDDGEKIADFDANGSRAVSKERDAYQKVYPELKKYVWTERLCGRHCLILPFFEEVDKAKRQDALQKVVTLYKERFGNLQIREKKVLWRHIGSFQGQLYLYSLGNLTRDGCHDGCQQAELERILRERLEGAEDASIGDQPENI